ncbi:hypothetical protein ACROYT_G035871 [Oculina patagonica]
MFCNTTFSPHNSTIEDWTPNSARLTSATVIAVLSPIAVAGNALILAAIWKKTFARTQFHILLSGLAFTDLCTGLIAQPFSAAATLLKVTNSRDQYASSLLYITLDTIGDSSAIYFISITVLFITVISIERWLHMSRRSLVTSRRGYYVVIIVLLIPIPAVVFRFLAYERHIYIMTSYGTDVLLLSYHVIRLFQSLPIYSSGVYVSIPTSFGVAVAVRVSKVLVFLSSSLNPGLYVWRMKDIRNGVKQLFCREY